MLFSNQSPFNLTVEHVVGDPNSMISPVCNERTNEYTTLTSNITNKESIIVVMGIVAANQWEFQNQFILLPIVVTIWVQDTEYFTENVFGITDTPDKTKTILNSSNN